MSQLAFRPPATDAAPEASVVARRPATAEDGEATVFISYSRKDMAFVDRLDAGLQARGVRTLVDRAAIEIGEPWRARLEDLIRRAETIVFVLSPDSIGSPVCAEEVAYGRRLGKRFIPVVARRVDNPNVPEALSELNYVYLDDEETYDARLDRLVAAIRTDLAWMRAHADLGRTAEEWSKAGRPRGLLLGATRLREAESWIAHRPANAPLPTTDTRALVAASRRAVRQRRNALVGALAFGLVISLALLAWALSQRQEAIRQTALAVQRERDASEQRDRAQRNFRIAKDTIDDVIFDLAQGLRQVDGIRISVLRAVLSRVETAMGRLTRAAPDDTDVQRSRQAMLGEFGDTYRAAGDGAAARAAYRQALDIARALVRRDPDNILWLDDVSVGLSRIGTIELQAGDTAGALAAYQGSLDIVRALVRREPDSTQRQQALSRSLNRVGDVKLQAGDAAGALAAYQEGLDIIRTLVRREPDNVIWQSDLGASLTRIGGAKLQTGDAAGTLAAYQEGLAVARTLVRRDPDNTEWQRNLSNDLKRVGDLRLRTGDAAAALTAYLESVEIARALVRRDPDNAQWQRDLATALDRISAFKRITGDWAGSLAADQEAFAIRGALVRRDPDNTEWQRDLMVSLTRLGDHKHRTGDAAGALAAYQEGLDVARGLVRRDPDHTGWQRDLAYRLDDIGDIKFRTGDTKGALAADREALDIVRALVRRDPNNTGWQLDLSHSLSRISDHKLRTGDMDGVLAAYQEGLGIARALVRRDPSHVGWRANLVSAGENFGRWAYHALRVRDFAGALQATDTALEFSPDALWVHVNRAHALMLLERVGEARDLYLKYRGRVAMPDNTWEKVVVEDFVELRQAGISHPLMAEIEALFARPR